MALLTLRTLTRSGDTTKNAPLTNAEIDQNFINIDAEMETKAPIASPTFTGVPSGPTAAAGTNTTQFATTAYVIAERSATATITNKTVTDATFTYQNSADTTKKGLFDLSGVTTGTTRTYSLPDVSGALATLGNASQTFTGAMTFSNTFTVSTSNVSVGTNTGTSSNAFAAGATTSGQTKTVNIATGGLAGSTTTVNFGNTAGDVNYTFNGKSSITLPKGTTAERPTGTAGDFRFNLDTDQFEGHNGTSWGAVGGGATGGANNPVFWENDVEVTSNYTITTGKNAGTFGPITVADGVVVTVPDGSVWTVV